MGQIVNLKQDLNWEVVQEPLMTSETQTHLPGWKSIRRSDNDHPLYCVKNSYSPMTNESFKETINKLSEITGFETKGFTEFNNGGTILGFLHNPDKVVIAGSEIDSYMIFGNSHDGASSIFVGTSTEYIRCTNQFTQIKRVKGLSISHTKNKDVKIQQLLQYIDLYQSKKTEMFESFREFCKINLKPEILENFLADVLQYNVGDELSTRKNNQRDELVSAIDRETKELGSNLWGAFNGLTYWTTHVKETKKDKVFGNALGTMAEYNDRGYKSALKILSDV